MDLDTKQYGELMSRIGGMESKLDHALQMMESMNKSYVGRDEYDRRHQELAEIMHERDLELGRRIGKHEERMNDHGKRIGDLEKTDAKASPRNSIVDHLGSVLLGGLVTFVVIIITHLMHLL